MNITYTHFCLNVPTKSRDNWDNNKEDNKNKSSVIKASSSAIKASSSVIKASSSAIKASSSAIKYTEAPAPMASFLWGICNRIFATKGTSF